ncbi:ArnT family glycosyltransferase [Candidatus Latescibacterota bacterium]
MKKTNKQKESPAEIPAVPKRSNIIAPVIVFALIGIVYFVTLLKLYPSLPIILPAAEDYPHYVEAYPPFRMDELNYYTIAKHILSGNLYEQNSVEMSYPAGFPLIAAPFVAVWDKMGGYIANMMIIWFSLIVFYLIAVRYVSQKKSLLMTAILAFATLNWFYAVSCYTEPLSQLFVLLAFYFLTWKRSSARYHIFLLCAGIMTGLNLFVRPHYILLAIPFFMFFWIERREKFIFYHKVLWYAGGVSLVVLLWFVRNKMFFGGFLSFEYTRLVGSFTRNTTSSFRGGNIFWGMHQLLFDKFHGLLTITPVFMIFPAGLRKMWHGKMKREALILFSSVSIITVFIAWGPYPFTGFGLGSRHLVPIIPLILLPAVFYLDGTKFPRIIFALLALYSFYHAGLGWFTGEGKYIGEYGFFPGLLNQVNSRAIIQLRKNIIPKREFKSKEEISKAFEESRTKNDYTLMFQTLHPDVLENIKGYEKYFVSYIRGNAAYDTLIVSLDYEEGIKFVPINFGNQ